MSQTFVAAAVQATPVYLDKEATTAKACELIHRAAEHGARLIVFPELFIAMYPLWVPDVFNSDPDEAHRYIGRNWYEHWTDYIAEAVDVPGAETARLGEAARAAGATVVIGVNERDALLGAGGKLYNTAVVIGPDGQLLGRRRKLTPVVHELLYHTRGDGSDVRLFDTDMGKLGIAQCFEHLYPPYRYALGAQGEQIHCSLWYAQTAISHLVEASARQHAMEMGSWVVVSASYDPEDPEPGRHGDRPQWRSAGGSGIVSPWGHYVAGPVYGEETIVYGEVDLAAITGIKAAFDSTGKDARPDLFELTVRSTARAVAAFDGARGPGGADGVTPPSSSLGGPRAVGP